VKISILQGGLKRYRTGIWADDWNRVVTKGAGDVG